MSIEKSPTATSAKAVSGAASHGDKGKGKVKSGDESGTTAGAGFAALLTSLEPQSDQGAAVDTPLGTDETPQMVVLPAAEPLIPLAPSLPDDLAMLLAQAGTVAGDKLNAVGDAGPGGATGGIRLVASAIGANKPDKPELPATASVSLGVDKFGDTQQNVNALLEQMTQALSVQTHKARGAELQADVAAKLAESRALKQASLADVVTREPALSGALLTSGMGDGVLRQAERTTAKSSALSAGSGVEGIWGQQAFQAGNHVDAPAVMADPSTLSLESMVADTVSYWVAQGVQNAELKLDGFGGQTVEVSISLKGDEAHIDFRTDQPEIRQVLEGAVAHLKDLLTSEGLVLSGVSVGTSGQDGKGAQEQRNRPGTRQATITTMAVAPTESRPRVNQSVGRAVDLFV